MPYARDRIRYPQGVAMKSDDRGIGAGEYSYRLVSTLGDVADAIESLKPRKHPAAPWPAVGKKALLEVVVQSANSVTDAFNAVILGRSTGYIWDLPTTKVAQAKLDIEDFIYNPLLEALTRRFATRLDLDEYKQRLERIIAELVQEIQAWKQIPDETDLFNALGNAAEVAGQVVSHTALEARVKELAAKGIMAKDVTTKDIPTEIVARDVTMDILAEIMARDVTTKDIPAEIMARDVTTKDIPAEIMAKGILANHMTTKTKTAVATTGSTVRPRWWKRLSGRLSTWSV